MKLFKWSLIRTARLAEIHARSRRLDQENNLLVEKNRSLQNTVTIQEEALEEQKQKSSLVKVSERENTIRLLAERLQDAESKATRFTQEAMSGNGVQNADPQEPSVLPEPLVFPPVASSSGSDAQLSTSKASLWGESEPGSEISSSDVVKQTGD